MQVRSCRADQTRRLVFDDHALESLGPQRAKALVVPVKPEAEALLEFLRKDRHIAHPLEQPLANVRVDPAPLGHDLPRQARVREVMGASCWQIVTVPLA